jgi:hypothetical protein
VSSLILDQVLARTIAAMAAPAAARHGFYRRTLEKLLANDAIDWSMTMLVEAGGAENRDVPYSRLRIRAESGKALFLELNCLMFVLTAYPSRLLATMTPTDMRTFPIPGVRGVGSSSGSRTGVGNSAIWRPFTPIVSRQWRRSH